MRSNLKAKPTIFALLLVAMLCLGASPGGAGSGGADFNLVIINNPGSFDLYNGGSLETLMGSSQPIQAQYGYSLSPRDAGITPTASYSDLSQLISDIQVQVWYIGSQQALLGLSDAQAGQLRAAAQKGAVVGYAGEEKPLMDELGLQSQNRFADIPDTTPVSYFANAKLDSVMEGYTLQTEGAQLGESWSSVLSWAYNQLNATVVQSSADGARGDKSSPWEALYNEQFNASSDGLSSSLTVSVYKLESTSQDSDWYRVDYIVQGSTQRYKVGWFSDGLWSMSGFITSITATATPYSKQTKLIEHIPATTLSNTTKSYSIGGSLELSKDPKAGGEVGYEISYDCPDVTMYDYTSQADGKGSWSAVPTQPNLTWMPIYYTEPALAGRTSYAYEPSMIYKLPKGEALELGLYNQTTFRDFSYWFLVVNDQRPTRTNSATISVIE